MTKPRAFLLAFNIFTALLWGWVLLEFFTKGRTIVPQMAGELYLLVLGYYVGDKEIRRWRKKYQSRNHPGELFVGGWLVTTLVIVAVEIFGGAEHGYHLPDQLALIVSGVLVIFVITEYLKTEFRKR